MFCSSAGLDIKNSSLFCPSGHFRLCYQDRARRKPLSGLNCIFPNSDVETQPLELENVTIFRHTIFKAVIKLKKLLGWALIESDWCPYKKDLDVHRGATDVTTLRKGHLHAKERGLSRNKPHRHLDLGFQSPN